MQNDDGNLPTTRPQGGTPAQAGDGWDSVPDSSASLIQGKFVVFKDGKWLAGKVAEMPAGHRYAVTGVISMWTKWVDGKPYHRLTRAGQRHPDREEIPDNDPELWPTRFGRADDPWKDGRHLFLIDTETAESFTFTTDTYGGRRAIADLKDAIMNMRAAHPGALPVVQLDTEKMKTQYGETSKPVLRVVDWKTGSGRTLVLPPDSKLPDPPPVPDMNDEVPF